MNAFFPYSLFPPLNQASSDGPAWPYYAIAALLIATAAILYLGRLWKQWYHRRHPAIPHSGPSRSTVRQVPRVTRR
jgi:hypothetical protein